MSYNIRSMLPGRHGHDWFPSMKSAREFIPAEQICLRCRETRVWLPTGCCLGNHPIAEHYDAQGELVPHPTCPGPR